MSLSGAALIAQAGLNTVAGEMSLVSRNIAGSGETFQSRKIAKIIATGSGSQLASVSRATNLAVFANVISSTAAAAVKDTLAAGFDRLYQSIDVSAGQASPAALLSGFTDALQAYASSPSDPNAARNAVSAAKSLAGGLNAGAAAVQDGRTQADSDLAAAVETVNALLGQFKTVNEQVVKGTAAGADVTDVLDQRDTILQRLTQEIGMTTSIAANNDMSIYTDSGVTLFQGGRARAVTFAATSVFMPSTKGNPVFVDGVPVTGSSATMPIKSGKIAGSAALRDEVIVTYQAQLDSIASALINSFAEHDQTDNSGPALPGLFTAADTSALPSTTIGLAAQINVNSNVDPSQGGDPALLRDGGISTPGSPNYTYNKDGHASYTDRIVELLGQMAGTRTFGPEGGITTKADVSNYATISVSWLSGERTKVAAEQTYQDVLLKTATSAFSNATGVNLDSEMSKMLDLEQSYSASAKLIAAIDGMFDVLFAAT